MFVLMKRQIPPTPESSMPAKRQRVSKKNARKSNNWKFRQGFENKIVKFPRTIVPFATYTTLKYCEGAINIDPAIVSSNAYVFRCNDLYDPNYTGTGHQPTGFDQLMALYNKFVVYASKIKVTGFAPDSETLDTVVGVAVRDGTSITTTLEEYMEQTNTDWAVVPGGAGATPFTVKTAFDLTKWSSTSPRTNDLVHGTSGAGPSKLWYYHVFNGATGAAENPSALKATIEIEYKVKFFEPKSLSVS